MISMTAHILAEESTRIEINHPLVIGEEVDALAHPAWIGDIAIQLKQALKIPVPVDIAPQMPNSASPVAFPVREFAYIDVASNHHAALRRVGDGIRHTEGKLAR